MTTIAFPIGFEGLFDRLPDEYGVAVGKESVVIKNRYNGSISHFIKPLSTAQEIPIIKFLMLKRHWEKDTVCLSSITEISMHPDYQKIIGMGKYAVPYILDDLRKNGGHWFWALKSITGEDPVNPTQRGDVEEMTKAWLQWGEARGYIE